MANEVLLSFDVEEFDLPLEYSHPIEYSDQIETSAAGLTVLLKSLDRLQIPATFFITAQFAQEKPDLIRAFPPQHEIASHAYTHSAVAEEDLATSLRVLEEISGRTITGFRHPRLQRASAHAIRQAGYLYSSSENPIFLPGRYNNLFRPRTFYREHGLIQIPVSATPLCRIPLFWLSFKRFPIWFLKSCLERTLRHDGYLCLYFHPWEFVDLQNFKIPRFIRSPDGKDMLHRLEDALLWLKTKAEFSSLQSFAENCHKI